MVTLIRTWLTTALVLLMSAPCPAYAAVNGGLAPSSKDKCAVCGMFVVKYPSWCARVGFKDTTYAWFDGPKDMFIYLLDLKKYNPGHSISSLVSIQVRDYYTLKPVDGRKAYYVTGSDVNGPMGKELVPFEKVDDARGFLKDHKGRRILKYGEVTAAVIESVE